MKVARAFTARGNTHEELLADAHRQAGEFFGPGIGYTLSSYTVRDKFETSERQKLWAELTATEDGERPGTGCAAVHCARCSQEIPGGYAHSCTDGYTSTKPA